MPSIDPRIRKGLVAWYLYGPKEFRRVIGEPDKAKARQILRDMRRVADPLEWDCNPSSIRDVYGMFNKRFDFLDDDVRRFMICLCCTSEEERSIFDDDDDFTPICAEFTRDALHDELHGLKLSQLRARLKDARRFHMRMVGHRALIKHLLEQFHCPILLEHVHPARAVIGPDTHFYDKESAEKIVRDGKWRSPLTRKEFTCPDSVCLKPVPHATVQMYEALADSYHDVVEELDFQRDFEIVHTFVESDFGLQKILVKYNGKSKDVTIPNGVTLINPKVFHNMQLTSVVIPPSVWGIGEHAFSWNSLVSVKFPENIQQIRDFAFSNNQLVSVEFPEEAEELEIWPDAFIENKLTEVTLPPSAYATGYSFDDSVQIHGGFLGSLPK